MVEFFLLNGSPRGSGFKSDVHCLSSTKNKMAEREMRPTQSDSYFRCQNFERLNKIAKKQYTFKYIVGNASNIRERNEPKMVL